MTRFGAFRTWLFEHAPAIALASFAFALLSAWTRWVPAALVCIAAAGIAVAFLIVSTIGIGKEFASKEELGFRRNRDMIRYDIAYKGLPDVTYGFATGMFIAVFLTGFWTPAVVLVVAGGLLGQAWAFAQRKWPSDNPPGTRP